MSNQSDFSGIQINNSYCDTVLNVIQFLDRCQSTGLAKEKRGIIASENPVMALISLWLGRLHLSSIKFGDRPQTESDLQKKLARFLEPPT
ncbi:MULTISPECIES: hypothetical protein [unclassified Microcoleus]|uniref:hypothetical protein n=1 Tax=unclassified Microcoleus TaxID=2642155 RepID=UPI002FD73558